jgi:hypothetical protein
MDPEGLLPCLQILFLSQKIHYRGYKTSFGARRSVTMFTDPVMDPEDS